MKNGGHAIFKVEAMLALWMSSSGNFESEQTLASNCAKKEAAVRERVTCIIFTKNAYVGTIDHSTDTHDQHRRNKREGLGLQANLEAVYSTPNAASEAIPPSSYAMYAQ